MSDEEALLSRWRGPSSHHLMRRLAESGRPRSPYMDEALYRVQVEWTCDLLDAVDEVCDATAGQMVADVIYGKLAGEGASAAETRQREAAEEFARLTNLPPMPFFDRRESQ